MAEFQITIIGLGTIGKSIGLALKQASKDLLVVGHDREPTISSAAKKAGAIDRADWNLPNSVAKANIVVLALPYIHIQETLKIVAQDLPEGCLVTDTASMKVPVMAWAKELLPAHVGFVGGDPTGARGRKSEACADLFNDTTYCLCPAANTPASAVEMAADLVTALGARPHFVEPEEHDGLSAALQQLPFVLSTAMLLAGADSPAWREMSAIGSGRLTQLLDVAGEDLKAQLSLASANRANLARWIENLQEALTALNTTLASDSEESAKKTDALVDRLLEARNVWDRHSADQPQPTPDYRAAGLRKLFTFGAK